MADQTQDVSQDNFVDDSTPTDALSGAPDATSDLENQATQNVPVGVSALIQQQANQNQPADDAQSDADMDDQDNPSPSGSMWKNLVLGALAGIAGVGPHTRTFGGGLVQGAGNELQQQQQQKDNALKAQQVANQTQTANDEHQEADARLGIMHVQQMDLARQYSLAPKSIQDVIDDESIKQGATLTAAGETPVATGLDHNAALAQQAQLMQSNKTTPLNVITTKDADGSWSVWQVKDANKTNSSPMPVTIGFQPGKKADGSPDYDNPTPVTVTAPAGSVSIANAIASPVAAMANFQSQRSAITQKQQEVKDAADAEVAKEKALEPIKEQEERAKQAISDGDPNSLAQLLVNGDVAPSQVVSSRKPEVATAAFAAAKKLNPQWNAQTAEGYFKAATGAGNVQFFGSANSLLDQGGTIDQTQKTYDELPNGRIPAINGAINWADKTIGGKAPSGFQAQVLGLADDYSKVMTGGQGSDSSRNAIVQSLTASSSPAQMQDVLAKMRQALVSQVSGRIGNNPVMRSMYGQNVPKPTQTQTPVSVTDPKGGIHTFPNQASADAFKKAAGIQ